MVGAVSWIVLRGLARAGPRLFFCSHLRQLHSPLFHPSCGLSRPPSSNVLSIVCRSVFKLPRARPHAFLWTSTRAIWWKRGGKSSFLLGLTGWRLAYCHGPHLVGCKSKRQPARLVSSRGDHDEGQPSSKFDWAKLWEIVSPDVLLLLLAAAVRSTVHIIE